jgi:hypothetical protein
MAIGGAAEVPAVSALLDRPVGELDFPAKGSIAVHVDGLLLVAAPPTLADRRVDQEAAVRAGLLRLGPDVAATMRKPSPDSSVEPLISG